MDPEVPKAVADESERSSAPEDLSGWSRERLEQELHLLRRHLDDRVADDGATAAGQLRTVDVPAGMEAPFLAAEGFVESYFENLVHDPERATVSIAGERYVLLRASSLSVEFVDLVASLYRNSGEAAARGVADNLLFDLAHAIGRADARAFHEKTGVEDPIARLSAGPVHFAFSGWAFVKIHADSRPSPDHDFFLHYDHPYSFESHAWQQKGRHSDRPVCIMNAGYSSGWCQESFGISLVAAELECCAVGAERCRFIMAPPGQIEDHLERLGYGTEERSAEGAHAISIPEFFQRRRWEEELTKVNARLEERVAVRTADLLRATDELRVLGQAVANAREGVVMLDAEPEGVFRIRRINHGFTLVTGLSAEQSEGRLLSVVELVGSDISWETACRVSIEANEPIDLEVSARRPDGSEYTLELNAVPVDEHDGEHRQWIGLFRDITRRQRHLAELRRQATIDALTELPNRTMLYERLEEEVNHAVATDRSMGLLVIDLDGFKNINDTFGHPVGDTLLEQVGPRLQRHLRAEDTVARLGGDEFAVILPGIRNRRNALKQAEVMLAALNEPFEVAGQEVVLGASIGVVLCPEHGADGSTLLRHGDVAMYVAKDRGRGPQIYRADLDRHSPQRLALVGELRSGIAEGQLVLHYQPQVACDSLRPACVEALVRWNHPVHGLLLPEEFVPYIELGNLVESLTSWVLEQAVADAVAWRTAGVELGVAINVPPRLLRDTAFADVVARTLARHGLAASALTLEVTESGLLADVEHALPVFEALRQFGVRLSIDDFGTGYSSFTHLRRLPVDEIKVDRSFVHQMAVDDQDAAIVRSTIDLGRSIGRSIVAEGVEDATVAVMLRDLGCNYMQGFGLAHPMPLEEMLAWLRANEQGAPLGS